MKRILLLIGLVCSLLPVFAQRGVPFYIYTANGLEDIVYTGHVNRFCYEQIGDQPPYSYNQIIYAWRGGLTLTVSDIDSVSFVTPPISVFNRPGKLNHLTDGAFRQLIYDYQAPKEEQKLLTRRPVVLDIWAKWCGPCKQMLPILKQMAEEYKDRVDFYKVDSDEEPEVRDALGVEAYPTIYFISPDGGHFSFRGSCSSGTLRNMIEQLLEQSAAGKN